MGGVGRLREEFFGDLKFVSNVFLERFLARHGIAVDSAEFLELEKFYSRPDCYRSIFKRVRRGEVVLALESPGLNEPAVEGKSAAQPVGIVEKRHFEGDSGALWESAQLQKALRIKDYSQATISSYVGLLDKFAQWLGQFGEKLRGVGDSRIFEYADQLVAERQVSSIYLRVFKAALHAYFSEIVGMPRLLPMLAGIRKRHALPKVLTREEVTRMIRLTTNLKHRAMLAVMYGSGLRVSEVIKLRIEDINFDNLTLRIRMAKGKKDRYSIFSESIVPALQELAEGRGGSEALFFSNQRPGKAVSARTLQNVFAQARRRARIDKPVSCHSMRHSFATHLLEGGTDLRVIQKLLGHKNIQTTTIYTGVAKRTLQNVRSPL